MSCSANIELYKFNFKLKALEDMRLPLFKGSMFRGAFGWAFKRAVCLTKLDDCNGCILKNNCSYFNVFETEIPENNIPFLRGVKKVPHPYIINSYKESRSEYSKGDNLNVELIIFGEYIKLFPFFVFTFQQMGKRGIGKKRYKFSLMEIENIISHNESEPLFNSNTNILNTNILPLKHSDKEINIPSKIQIEFVSPLRIQSDGTILNRSQQVTEELLLNLFLRRYNSVTHLFFHSDIIVDSQQFTNSSFQISNNELVFNSFKRYSNRQKKKMDFGGFIGKILLTVYNEDLLNIIYCVENFNLGKNTSFGMGKYVIK